MPECWGSRAAAVGLSFYLRSFNGEEMIPWLSSCFICSEATSPEPLSLLPTLLPIPIISHLTSGSRGKGDSIKMVSPCAGHRMSLTPSGQRGIWIPVLTTTLPTMTSSANFYTCPFQFSKHCLEIYNKPGIVPGTFRKVIAYDPHCNLLGRYVISFFRRNRGSLAEEVRQKLSSADSKPIVVITTSCCSDVRKDIICLLSIPQIT